MLLSNLINNKLNNQLKYNKEKEINATHGIDGIELHNHSNFFHRKHIDEMALNGNFKNIYIHNDMPDEMTHKVLADGTIKNILKDTGNKFRNNIHYKILQEYINNIKTHNIRGHIRIDFEMYHGDSKETRKLAFNSKTELIKTKNNI